MDLANTLIRKIARAFYPPEQIIIIDAIITHSALRDEDLAYLMGMQTKALRKSCSKLREDGLIAVHSRPEVRDGANRPFARDYYFVDTHRAIDVIKWRLKSMAKLVEKKYGQSVEEKKMYRCPRCKSAYTELEILDEIGPMGPMCKRCGSTLVIIAEEDTNATAGHEVQSRMNAQMSPFEELLKRIDGTEIPEVTFDDAIARAVPVQRDASTNPVARTTVVQGGRLPPQTVHGMKTEEKIEISLMDDKAREEQEKKDAEARAKFREQNQLPSWYTGSTVQTKDGVDGGDATPATNGGTVGAETSETKFNKGKEEDDDQKKADTDLLNSIYAAEADDSDDEEDDDDSEDEEDEDEKPSTKRVKIEEPTKASDSGGGTDGISKEIEAAYGGESSGDESD